MNNDGLESRNFLICNYCIITWLQKYDRFTGFYQKVLFCNSSLSAVCYWLSPTSLVKENRFTLVRSHWTKVRTLSAKLEIIRSTQATSMFPTLQAKSHSHQALSCIQKYLRREEFFTKKSITISSLLGRCQDVHCLLLTLTLFTHKCTSSVAVWSAYFFLTKIILLHQTKRRKSNWSDTRICD